MFTSPSSMHHPCVCVSMFAGLLILRARTHTHEIKLPKPLHFTVAAHGREESAHTPKTTTMRCVRARECVYEREPLLIRTLSVCACMRVYVCVREPLLLVGFAQCFSTHAHAIKTTVATRSELTLGFGGDFALVVHQACRNRDRMRTRTPAHTHSRKCDCPHGSTHARRLVERYERARNRCGVGLGCCVDRGDVGRGYMWMVCRVVCIASRQQALSHTQPLARNDYQILNNKTLRTCKQSGASERARAGMCTCVCVSGLYIQSD